jgi:hypothetical protein
MRVSVSGIDELREVLEAVEDTIRNIGVTSAFVDAIFPAISAEIVANFQEKGRRHADGIQDGGRMPWGTYSRTWMSGNAKIGLKQEGEVYWLIESEDMINSLTELNAFAQRIDQSPRQITIESRIVYAGQVQQEYGAYLAAGQLMLEAVEDELEKWLMEALPGEWVRA